MKKKLSILIGIISLGISLEANDIKEIEPFGIKFNQPLNKAIVYKDISGSDMKVISNPPRPVALFIMYGVSLNKANKVTTVVGLGETHEDDDYCFTSQSEFTKIKDILTKKYGTPSKSTNYLFYDSIWKDSKDYKMSLVKNERVHYASWDTIPNHPNIEIYLTEDATRSGCFVKLVYKDKKLNLAQEKEQEKSDINSF